MNPMIPVIVHADGTDCHHAGQPQATMPGGAPLCAAGLPVTHIRFNGQVLTIEQAAAAFMKLAEAFSEAVKPLMTAFARFAAHVTEAGHG